MPITRIHHAAITVSDLNRSLDFYQRVLGAELVYIGESRTQGVSQDQFENIVGIREANLKYAFMRFGDTMFEFIYYISPRGRPNDNKHNDAGTPHFAFQVDDVYKVYEELSSRGVKFHNPPVEVHVDGIKDWVRGWRFTYFTGPDGELLEIFQELR